MAQFKTIQEAVLRNDMGCELSRTEVTEDDGYFLIQDSFVGVRFSVGDTITIEERETEIE